ncbi:hypothetical protein I5E68_07055 [Novosphingobium sp. YJ-S2-02]|uniref:Lipoprotein n=1 Tax=Novosphingobium aureum TaxID=2792964 RepID=A0A931HC00_9SPHN|nr:hypothetical protein [Novosphingobium aureum]MBH0112708.1 hypothetical protein [Novosphingobium aureum]
MRLFLMVFGLLTLASCTSKEQRAADVLKADVANKMKDPESSRFSKLKFHLSMLCGEVNAKNSFGAYAGAEPFTASSVSAQLRSEAEAIDANLAGAKIADKSRFTRIFDSKWEQCQRGGVVVE